MFACDHSFFRYRTKWTVLKKLNLHNLMNVNRFLHATTCVTFEISKIKFEIIAFEAVYTSDKKFRISVNFLFRFTFYRDWTITQFRGLCYDFLICAIWDYTTVICHCNLCFSALCCTTQYKHCYHIYIWFLLSICAWVFRICPPRCSENGLLFLII